MLVFHNTTINFFRQKPPPNDTPSNPPKSPTTTNNERPKSPVPDKTSLPEKEESSALTERVRSPIEEARSSTERARSPSERARSPSERARSPSERARSPVDRTRSPVDRARSPVDRARSPIAPIISRSPSLTKPDTCDSSTVSVPSPVDAEKMIDDLQKEALCNTTKVVKKQPHIDQKEDIEDMITNYHIKNKVPNPALLADLAPEPPDQGIPEQRSETIEIEDVKEAEPDWRFDGSFIPAFWGSRDFAGLTRVALLAFWGYDHWRFDGSCISAFWEFGDWRWKHGRRWQWRLPDGAGERPGGCRPEHTTLDSR
ncbi:hypothetical protein HF086_006693 [Spodoptera exigua]|uniref:Uncharacterized protein n=1 Tax=Spodoptera exigua TaxID=7107 RepID=A0A922MZC3_SPOEX|nr:hypothetical protein HF086_006693 [Spodoptera exigua]